MHKDTNEECNQDDGEDEDDKDEKPVNIILNKGLEISHVCWQNLAGMSRDRAESL